MPRGRPKHPDVLTPREWEVLSLLREGLTNPQIADRLGISENGAKYHVLEILSKLGVSSRHEAAAWQREPAAVSRRYGLIGALLALRPPKLAGISAPKLGTAVLATTVAGFLGMLALGVIVMDQRSGGSASNTDKTSQVALATTPASPGSSAPAPSPTPRLRAGIPIGPDRITEMPSTAHEKLSEVAAGLGIEYAGICSSSTPLEHVCLAAFDGAGDVQHNSILAQIVIPGTQSGYQVVLAPVGTQEYVIRSVMGPVPSAIPPRLLESN